MGSSDSDAAAATPQLYQNVVVMRHGDRLDNFVPLWAASAPRPWDPPLVEDGKVRAFGTGEKFRKQLGFPIHRIFVSPFLRCLQTAAEVVSALCAVANTSDDPNDLTSNGVIVDPSKIKVSTSEQVRLQQTVFMWSTAEEALFAKLCIERSLKEEVYLPPSLEEPYEVEAPRTVLKPSLPAMGPRDRYDDWFRLGRPAYYGHL
ncbi:UNVERIFIED_CONTAM: hypothetical protein Scaly_1605900 [Sesamum calycinum]|uniref:Phosphoglycerate mutase family protein n=1 Tax=Sesamum calycinum TaxID=2727403 RepID=A0AAW2P7C7_9LAMI